MSFPRRTREPESSWLRLLVGLPSALLVLLAIGSVPSSSRASDFVKLGSPFASPTNLYSIASVYDRGPKLYEAWAVGEELDGAGSSLAPPKGVLAYYNGTFWTSVDLPTAWNVPALRSVAALRYLRTIDSCGKSLDNAEWTSTAWAVGDGGYILKLDQYSKTWKLLQKKSGVTENPCPPGSEGTGVCENWTGIDLKAVAALNEASAVAGGANVAGGLRNGPLHYTDGFVDSTTACQTTTKRERQETWSLNPDPADFLSTDEVRAIYAIDDSHYWLAGVNGATGKIWKYTRQGGYQRVLDARIDAEKFTSIAAVLRRSAAIDDQPLPSIVWAGTEDGDVLRFNESDVAGSMVVSDVQAPAIRSLAIGRRAGGRNQNLLQNGDFSADRRDSISGAGFYPDGWTISGRYVNARGNTAVASFLDAGYNRKGFVGAPWQSIGSRKNEAVGSGAITTHASREEPTYPYDYLSSSLYASTYTTVFGADPTTDIRQLMSGSSKPPYLIGTIIYGYLKVPNNDAPKSYQFRIESGTAASPNTSSRIAFNIEDDTLNKVCVNTNWVPTGSTCPIGTECNAGESCADITRFPSLSRAPDVNNSLVRWPVGMCRNNTTSGSKYNPTYCFDDSECYWGTCSNDSANRCRVNGDCKRCFDFPTIPCSDDDGCPSGTCDSTPTCDAWLTSTPPPLCTAPSGGTVETPLVTFPGNKGMFAKVCSGLTSRSCTSDNQCTGAGTCQILGGGSNGGWYPFEVQYFQPWTPRCSNDDTRPCMTDIECGPGTGDFCQIGKWCQDPIGRPCQSDGECDSGSCAYNPVGPQASFTVKYQGKCKGDASKACRQDGQCPGATGPCQIETDSAAPLRLKWRENGVGLWQDVPNANLLNPSPVSFRAEIVQEVPGSLLPGVSYKVSGWYKTEFTDAFDAMSPVDPRLPRNPHAGISVRCKNDYGTAGGTCGYDLNLFQTDPVTGVSGDGKCDVNTAVSCSRNEDCRNAGAGTSCNGRGECTGNASFSCNTKQDCISQGLSGSNAVCRGHWTQFSAILTKQNRDASVNPIADDPGQGLEILCFADTGATIACDDITVVEENNAALTGFDVIDVWAVGDGGMIVRNTLDIASAVGGDNWVPQKPAQVDLTSITAPDAYHFWSVGQTGGGEQANIMRLSPGNVRGWAWIGTSTDSTKLDPLGWIDFNCGNLGTCTGQPSAFGVNVNDSPTYGQCDNNLQKACQNNPDCDDGNVANNPDICVTGVISGSAWIGSQDQNETLDFGPCQNINPGVCNRHCTNNVNIRCFSDGDRRCTNIDDSCASAVACTSDAPCVGPGNSYDDGPCNFSSSTTCSNSTCGSASSRQCTSGAQCYGTCAKNQGFKCKQDSDCKVNCQTNPLACRSTGWLSFDKSVVGTPPAEPYNNALQPYIARFDAATSKIDGWGRFQFGRCLCSGTPSASTNIGCYQSSQCPGPSLQCPGGESCDWTYAPAVSPAAGATILPADAYTKAGWVKLRGEGLGGVALGRGFLKCGACDAQTNNPQDDTCKLCAADYQTGDPVACNTCNTCTQKRCDDRLSIPPSFDPCVDSTTCGGYECKPFGICVEDGSLDPCFSDGDCEFGSCTPGAACGQCTSCDEYGVALDMSPGGRASGLGWSPDVGWIDMAGASLGSQLFFQTLYGDIYSGGNIGSGSTATPPGYPGGVTGCNATYRIIAKGTITNFCSSAQPDPPDADILTSPFLRQSDQLYPLPSRDNRYTSQVGELDITGLTTDVDPSATLRRNKFGNDIVCKDADANDVCDAQDVDISELFPGPAFKCQPGDPPPGPDADLPLLGRVYYINGDLDVNSDITFDPPVNCATTQQSGAGTFVVEGALNVNANIVYRSSGSNILALRQLPSVAFVVKGDINVSSSVSAMVGAYYSEKTIRVGSSSGTDSQLVVNGLMIANKFDFRRKYRGTGGAPEPAELIVYDGRLHANTPPGLSNVATALPNAKEVLP